MWMESGSASKAPYNIKVDYLLFVQDDTNFIRADLVNLVGNYRADLISWKDTTSPLPEESIGTSDLLGTWDGQGIYFRNSDSCTWSRPLASPATAIASGYLDCDTLHDIIGVWPDQGGVWATYSLFGGWTWIASPARDIAVKDMDGDGGGELLGTWDGQGVFWNRSPDSLGAWVMMATPAEKITAGDLDCDGIDDLIGIWPAQNGVYVKYSSTMTWARIASTARDIAVGDMNNDGRIDLVGTWDGQGVFYRNTVTHQWVAFQAPDGAPVAPPAELVGVGDLDGDGLADLVCSWINKGGGICAVSEQRPMVWPDRIGTPRYFSGKNEA